MTWPLRALTALTGLACLALAGIAAQLARFERGRAEYGVPDGGELLARRLYPVMVAAGLLSLAVAWRCLGLAWRGG